MADPTALVALVVSLVALFVTVGQLLQQYFATADGFRRCQPSVMGLWAKRTKLRFRWREFRFETVFTIPRIRYGSLFAGSFVGDCSLTNTPQSLKDSMTFPGWGFPYGEWRKYYQSDELACWVPLLAQLHLQGADIVKFFPLKQEDFSTTVPYVQYIRKTWDFMPPDIVRPMASTTVSDIAIMARRMGLVWKNFDPAAGSMRAEGNGHVITSTIARSFGTILQYTWTSTKSSGPCIYIPKRQADKLGFGLVEFDERLFGSQMGGDLEIGSLEGISRTLRLILRFGPLSSRKGLMKTILREVSEAMKGGKDLIPGLNDLVPLCLTMLRGRFQGLGLDGSALYLLQQVPSPNTYSRGVTASIEALAVFQKRLQEIQSIGLSKTEHSSRISAYLKELLGHHLENENGDEFRKEDIFGVEKPVEFKEMCMMYHEEMTQFLVDSKVSYPNLVADHVYMSVLSVDSLKKVSQINAKSENNKNNDSKDANGKNNDNKDYDIKYQTLEIPFSEIGKTMNDYFDKLPDIVRMGRERTLSPGWKFSPPTSGEIQDAWLSMMFRAFCWQACHYMIEGVPPLPSEYWNSKMPVYIG